jgi:hypothetical protein
MPRHLEAKHLEGGCMTRIRTLVEPLQAEMAIALREVLGLKP